MATIKVTSCNPYKVGDTYNKQPITKVECLGKIENGERKYLITTASSSLEEAKEWASQLWAEMFSYHKFDMNEFIAQLEGHFTNEVLSQIRELYS